MNLNISTLNAAAITTVERGVHIILGSGKVTDRKLMALDVARNNSEAAVRAIAYGSGTVAKEARAQLAELDGVAIATAIANGDLMAFASKWAACTGETVKFGEKGADGAWIRKPTQDFREFGGVIAHRWLQLEDKGKLYTSKGGYTSAAADLAFMKDLHRAAVALMDKRDAENAARRAALADERKSEAETVEAAAE